MPSQIAPSKTGPEMVAEIAEDPSKYLDEAMRRDPKTMDREFRLGLIETLRKDRALYIQAEEKRAAKRRGEEEIEDDEQNRSN